MHCVHPPPSTQSQFAMYTDKAKDGAAKDGACVVGPVAVPTISTNWTSQLDISGPVACK